MNFNLPVHQKYDVDFVLNKFEAFCEPICNFKIACFKFSKVHQYQGESIDVFYNHILKAARQCEFSNIDERLINAITFWDKTVPKLRTSFYRLQKQCPYKSVFLYVDTMRV